MKGTVKSVLEAAGSQARAYWAARSSRERALLMVAGVLIVIVTFFVFLYRPVAAYHQSAERAWQNARALHAEVVAGAREAKAAERRQTSGESVRAIVSQAARDSGLVITRLEPMEESGLTVWFEDVEIRPLHAFVLALYRDHGVAAAKASIYRHEDRATVRAQVQFAGRAGS